MELPKKFIERTQPLMKDEWLDFLKALEEDPKTSIRINTSKLNADPDQSKVPWCDNGYYLSERPQFTFDPLFHAGAYYVQEASSMFVEQAVKQLITDDMRALDLCAAPGGKSTLLSSSLSKDSLLVSNEIIRSRANILSENMMKWGNPNHVVTNNKPENFTVLKHFFDLILVDAPCSGEGMFRKNIQSIEEWSTNNVMLCAQRQKDILSSVWDALKPGGYLLYSTCTYNREENEEIVEWLCTNYDASVVELKINEEWKITESLVNEKVTYHFYPHRTEGEGFYFAVIQKGADEKVDTRIFKQKKNKSSKKKSQISNEHLSYLEDNEFFTLLGNDVYINAFDSERLEELQILRQHLNVISFGICLGQIKGKDFIPHQSLALSNKLNRNSFEEVEVDWQTAITFLRTETFSLPHSSKGYILLTYKNIPLGFVKNLGNRANNLYPNEWRIRTGRISEDFNSFLD